MNPGVERTAAPADVDSYDFVVVGSGAGGGPLAARLALAGHSVLVLEAGRDHACPYYSIPIMQAYASEDPDMRWDFFVRHWDEEAEQRRDEKLVAERDGVLYPRGSTVGGSTAVSAMVTIYPHDSDWERLAELTGDPGWGPAPMRERFHRIERWRGAEAAPLPGEGEAERDARTAHGRDGWLGTTRADPAVGGREPMFLDIIGAIEAVARERYGIPAEQPQPRDPNAADTPGDYEGMAFIPVAVSDGERNGSRERLEDVARHHPDRLTIRTESLVTRVLIEDGRAVGVEVLEGPELYGAAPHERCGRGRDRDDDRPPAVRTVRAKHEVILAAGAFNTPQILKLSGIGPAAELRGHGIEVVRDAPGVGENLHDRYEVSVVAQLDHDYPVFEGVELDVPADPDSDDRLFSEWRDRRDGPYTTNGSLAALIARSSVAKEDSDLIVFALPIEFRGYYPGYSRDGAVHHDRVSVLVLKGHTNNRAGSVRLRSSDPRDVPDIRFRYFEEGSPGWQEDLQGVVDGVNIAREIVAHLETPVVREIQPGPDARSEEALGRWVRDEAWGHHACGTARIGRADDPDAVLDGDFRVRGVDGLRVVDASVFPDIPGFFIASAVYLVSEKAAEAILAEYPPSAIA